MLVDGRYKDAQSQLDRVRKPNALWREKSTAKSGGYRHLKAYMMAVDQGVGQPRLPTLPVEREEVDELKTIFRQIGWLPSQD
jgi:hypothetical protein